MIQTFKHEGLKEFFETGAARGIPTSRAPRIQQLLDTLDQAKDLRDVNLPGFSFHALKGDRKGEFAIKVTGNYRLTFKFQNGHAREVDLEDYH